MAVFLWVCTQMGIDPKTLPKPNFVPVTPTQMASIVCEPMVECQIPVAKQMGRNIFIVFAPGTNYLDNRQLTSYVVHEMVHYIQVQKFAKKPKLLKKYEEAFENQALIVQDRYYRSIEI